LTSLLEIDMSNLTSTIPPGMEEIVL